ncbi:lipoprotein [Pseudoalteromonas sp. 68 DY56-GL68]|jgi:predicted small lipoprotein YifL|uniref:LPS translocon maturation chaperone LptM n=1 Tax=Pseudoalteromonas sp. 68 DY56-GL68 TaxID=2974919 RepID=UPI00352B33C8
MKETHSQKLKIILPFALLLTLVGCGQSGALYLPDDTPQSTESQPEATPSEQPEQKQD